MASYQLIKEAGEERTLDLHRKNCAVRIDGGHGGDVESAFQKINPSSPRLKSGFSNGANVPSGCTPSSPRLVSLDVFRGLTVVLTFIGIGKQTH